MATESAWPLLKLEKLLNPHDVQDDKGIPKDQRIRDDSRILYLLQVPVMAQVAKFCDFGVYDRSTEDYRGANCSDCWLACREVIVALLQFCDAANGVCLRALRIYGRQKQSTSRFHEV